MFTTRRRAPFGLEVSADRRDTPLGEVDAEQLRAWVAAHRLALLRGFRVGDDEAMLAFCRQLGTILEWEFGAVNELQVRPDARNYLYTTAAVPMHWDGAFVGRVPHTIFFHCQAAPPAGSGGETTFCDAVAVLKRASPEERKQWQGVSVTYTTEKVVHYGGTFTAPLVGRHPVSGEEVLRYAEPVEDLNPVRLEIHGLPAGHVTTFIEDMHRRLNDPELCYAHAWQTGDVVLADNHGLLHGRRAFTRAAARHLRRVNIL
jgi:alpha-ketoglutarate-dependent taurine dioxygenase